MLGYHAGQLCILLHQQLDTGYSVMCNNILHLPMIAMITTTATDTPAATAPVLEDPSLPPTSPLVVMLLLGVMVGGIIVEVIVIAEVVVLASC